MPRSFDKSLSLKLQTADERNQIGYARYLCECYLQQHPDDVITLIRYANNLISLAQYAPARKALARAQKNVPEKHLHLVLAQRGHLLKAEGDFAGAEKMYLRAHKLAPDDATHLIFAGSAAFDGGHIKRATKLTRKATQCPQGCLDEAWFNLGGYLLSARKYQEAADCYRRALKLTPDYEIAKTRLKDVNLILRMQGQKTPKGKRK